MAGYQIYDNLPTIQIIIIVNYTLRQFYQKVKRAYAGFAELSEIIGIIDSFRTQCPICHANKCASFLGFYYRPVVDEKGKYYPDFPVPRFVCKEKGKAQTVNHRTFSLLHYHLIPYSIYSLTLVIHLLRLHHCDGKTVSAIEKYLDHLSCQGESESHYQLSDSGILGFKHLFLNAIVKILASGYYPLLSAKLAKTDQTSHRIKILLDFFLDFMCQKVSPPIRGPCALSYDFYMAGGSYLRNALFLFGTPSQFRKINNKQENKKMVALANGLTGNGLTG